MTQALISFSEQKTGQEFPGAAISMIVVKPDMLAYTWPEGLSNEIPCHITYLHSAIKIN